jgi:hypothetical protein
MEAHSRRQLRRCTGRHLRLGEIWPEYQHRQCARTTIDAKVEVLSGVCGTAVSISHTTFSKAVDKRWWIQ